MLYIIGLGFLVYRVSPHYVRLSAPRLLSCCALEQCLTLEVIHVSTPAWNMTGRRHRQAGRYVVLREICALATPIVNLGLRELRWPAFTVGCWSFHEELRKSGGGDCIVTTAQASSGRRHTAPKLRAVSLEETMCRSPH
jgi:hypothetical protein